MVTPILEKLSAEYAGKVAIYKVDTDKEPELAGAFGIQSIPSLLFIPQKGEPQMARGALSREAFDKAIAEILGVKKDEAQPHSVDGFKGRWGDGIRTYYRSLSVRLPLLLIYQSMSAVFKSVPGLLIRSFVLFSARGQQ